MMMMIVLCHRSAEREIALTMRDRVFEEHKEQLIDIYDIAY